MGCDIRGTGQPRPRRRSAGARGFQGRRRRRASAAVPTLLIADPKECIGLTIPSHQEHRQVAFGRRSSRTPASQDARAVVADGAGGRSHHWRRHLCADGNGGGGRKPGGALAAEGAAAQCPDARRACHWNSGTARRRTGHRAFFFPGGGGLRAGGAVLRGAGLDDSHRRQRLHLHLRDAWANWWPGSSAGT